MEPKGSKAVVGFFVLLLGVGVVATILWLAGFGRGAYVRYHVFMTESVSGLARDAAVKYKGVDVGRVALIQFRPNDPETIQLTLEVDPKAPVREDTRATLEFQGMTGLAFMNLVGGSRESPPLRRKRGQSLPVIEATPSILARLDTGISGLLVSLRESSDKMSNLLSAVDRDKLAHTLDSLERVSAALAAHSDEGTKDASRFFSNAADASERLPELMTQMEGLAKEWSAASADVRELTTTGRAEISRASNQVTGETQTLAVEMRRLVSRLDRLVGELEADPSVVLHGRGDAKPGPGEEE